MVIVTITYTNGYKYQLVHDVRYQLVSISVDENQESGTRWLHLSARGMLIIRKGYTWNGPSGPTFNTKNFMRGSLIHDALYQLIRAGMVDSDQRDNCDMELDMLLEQDGMSRLRRWWVRKGLKRFGSVGERRQVHRAP